MALRCEIVNLVRLHRLNDADQVRRIRHIAVVDLKIRIRDMRILVDVVDARRVERRRAPLYAMNDIPLAQQELGKICAILSGDSGNECYFHRPFLARLTINCPVSASVPSLVSLSHLAFNQISLKDVKEQIEFAISS